MTVANVNIVEAGDTKIADSQFKPVIHNKEYKYIDDNKNC